MTKNTREQLEEFALHLKSGTTKGNHRVGTYDTVELTELVEAMLAQSKQETIQECIDALPEKEYRFNDMDICFCGTVLEVDDSDFPRRVSHQDCPAIKAIDTAHTALNKLKEQE